jgi:hypothetical protein
VPRRKRISTIRDSLPEIYRPLLPPFFSGRAPRETAALCLSCPMLPEQGSPGGASALFFDPGTKCCTYSPSIPNYLVGGLLGDASPALADGRSRIRERIRSRFGVTPWGLIPGRRFELLYSAGAGQAFGRSSNLRCHFHDPASGHCTVRPWWESTCHTWFCKHVHGKDGLLFWQALRRYLKAVEEALTAFVLDRTGLPPDDLPGGGDSGALSAGELDERPVSEAEYRRLWGRFAGHEEDFYRRAFRLVSGLTRKEFQEAGGALLALRLRALRKAHATALARSAPPALRRAPSLAATHVGGGRYRLTTYSEYDPLVVSRAVFLLLDEFDGERTNRQIGAALRRAGKTVLPGRLVLQLHQARILVVP